MKNNVDILHLTTSHKAEDNRITFGQALSLNKRYNVVVAGLLPREIDGLKVKLIEVKSGNIIKRIFYAIKLGIRINPNVIQLHDPEMLLPGLIFLLFRIKIVFDFHEDFIRKWLPSKGGFSFKSWIFKNIEKISVPFYSFVIAADSHVYQKYNPKKTILIGNYPPLKFLDLKHDEKKHNDSFNVVYLGTIHEQRGLIKCVEAINLVDIPNVKLHIIGNSKYPELTKLFKESERVIYHGRVNWEILNKELSKMDVGMAVLQPVPAFTYSPGENIVKLFEYAGLGIPFIISDFPGIRNFIERNGGGLLVDPTDVKQIASTIEQLYHNKKLYYKLSEEGKKMVINEYNWDKQEKVLLEAYGKLFKK